MKFDIFCKNSEETDIIKKQFYDFFIENNFDYDENTPDCCLIVGGDGTVLRAVHKHFDSLDKTKFVVIHDGTLGFFADFQKDEMPKICEIITQGKYEIKKMPLIQLDIHSVNGKNTKVFAFNEVTIQNFRQTMIADVLIDNRHLEKFRGSGFCISTPSGSTAYNKSLNGAIIYRDLEAFQLTEIASINHNKYHSLNAPLILSKNHIITIKPVAQSELSISADFNSWLDKSEWLSGADDEFDRLDCSLSDKYVQFILPFDACYVKRLKRCFIV